MIADVQVSSTPAFPSCGNPKWVPGSSEFASNESQREEGKRKVKVMVIDDEALIAETIVEILSQEGFEATAVSNSSSAVELAGTLRPDIVLSDVIMPGLNGIDAGIKIREINPKCKIILFSGQAATVDLLEKARRKGHVFDILAKPIKPEQLITVIRANSGFTS